MQKRDLRKLNKKEHEIVDLLRSLKMNKSLALVIVALEKRGKLNSNDLVKTTGLTQPAVSTAMNTLREKKWVKVQPNTQRLKGRPLNVYQLNYSLESIINMLEEQILSGQQETFNVISRLKQIA